MCSQLTAVSNRDELWQGVGEGRGDHAVLNLVDVGPCAKLAP